MDILWFFFAGLLATTLAFIQRADTNIATLLPSAIVAADSCMVMCLVVQTANEGLSILALYDLGT